MVLAYFLAHPVFTFELQIKLHKRVIIAIQRHHRTQAHWQALIRRALYLEDVHQAELTGQFSRFS